MTGASGSTLGRRTPRGKTPHVRRAEHEPVARWREQGSSERTEHDAANRSQESHQTATRRGAALTRGHETAELRIEDHFRFILVRLHRHQHAERDGLGDELNAGALPTTRPRPSVRASGSSR